MAGSSARTSVLLAWHELLQILGFELGLEREHDQSAATVLRDSFRFAEEATEASWSRFASEASTQGESGSSADIASRLRTATRDAAASIAAGAADLTQRRALFRRCADDLDRATHELAGVLESGEEPSAEPYDAVAPSPDVAAPKEIRDAWRRLLTKREEFSRALEDCGNRIAASPGTPSVRSLCVGLEVLCRLSREILIAFKCAQVGDGFRAFPPPAEVEDLLFRLLEDFAGAIHLAPVGLSDSERRAYEFTEDDASAALDDSSSDADRIRAFQWNLSCRYDLLDEAARLLVDRRMATDAGRSEFFRSFPEIRDLEWLLRHPDSGPLKRFVAVAGRSVIAAADSREELETILQRDAPDGAYVVAERTEAALRRRESPRS